MEVLDSRSKHKMESLEENSHQQLRRWEKVEKGLAQGVAATSKGGMGEDKEGRSDMGEEGRGGFELALGHLAALQIPSPLRPKLMCAPLCMVHCIHCTVLYTVP